MSIMANVDNFESFIKLMIDGGNGDVNCGISFEQAGAIITLLRQAEKDAARYRWLREARDLDSMQHQVFNKSYGFLLDSDIDEAMNGSNN